MKYTIPATLFSLSILMAIAGPFKDGDRVVCFGDSITHNQYWTRHIDNYYLTRFPEAKIMFFNGGVGGDTANGCLSRLDEDVTQKRPTAITVMFGMNDVGISQYAEKPTSVQQDEQKRRYAAYQANMPALAAKLKMGNPDAQYYWFTPSPYDDTVTIEKPAYAKANSVGLARFAEVVRDLQKVRGGTLVDMWKPMTAFNLAQQKKSPTFTLCGKDRVHPQMPGALFMAWRFLLEQHAPCFVSHTVIDAPSKACLAHDNSEVYDIGNKGGGLSFILHEKALPWPIADESYARIVANTTMARDLNREILSVKGLEPGMWKLSIDGELVLTASAEDFAAGVDLADNALTPMYKQALAVVKKNDQRASLESGKYRNLYAFRWFASRRNVDVNDWKAVTAFITSLKGKTGWFEKMSPSYLENWPKRAEIEAELNKLREETYALNKPVAHTFTLKK